MGQPIGSPLCFYAPIIYLLLFHFHHCRFAYCTRDQVGLN